MAMISTRTHAAGDYAGGALLIAIASRLRSRRAANLLRLAGGGYVAAAAVTDNELGLWRKLPMRVHLALDGAVGGLLTAWAIRRGQAGARRASWVAQAFLGAGQLAAALLTDRTAGGTAGTETMPAATTAPAATPTPVAAAPVETPGPSVTPPAQPESDVERAERVDASLPEQSGGGSDDELVAQQEAAAAAEAASIGGPHISLTGDPAMDPVYEAGGGEEEGFEEAERELVENASHGDGHGDPARDAISPEVEADRSTAAYGEADEEHKDA